MTDKKFILFIEGENNGCNFYRIRQPYLKLQERENFFCASTVDLKSIDNINLWMDKSHIIFSQTGTSLGFLKFMEEHPKTKFWFDFDDDIFNISPYNPAYRTFGVDEIQVTMADDSKKMLWQNGVNGFDMDRNLRNLGIFCKILSGASLVTTTCPNLAEILKQHGARNVKIIKNFINFKNWYPVNIVKDEFVRIGYQGGWSHYEDWCEIRDVLRIIMSKYKNVKLVLMGQTYDGCMKDLPSDRIEKHDWVSIEAYPYKFKTLNIDIGICPLADKLFNKSKSEIKWEEYSSLGIPTVATSIAPYNVAIDHEKTGLLASNTQEWVEYLSKLIEDSEYRRKLGETAQRYVKENYDIEKNIDKYELAANSLLMKEILVVK